MSGRLNLWGEIEEHEEDKIVTIAEEAAEKRGYAIYADYNEYMEPKIRQAQLEPADIGRVQEKILLVIKETLATNGWTPTWGNRERRFYPPSYSSREQTELKMGKEKVS